MYTTSQRVGASGLVASLNSHVTEKERKRKLHSMARTFLLNVLLTFSLSTLLVSSFFVKSKNDLTNIVTVAVITAVIAIVISCSLSIAKRILLSYTGAMLRKKKNVGRPGEDS